MEDFDFGYPSHVESVDCSHVGSDHLHDQNYWQNSNEFILYYGRVYDRPSFYTYTAFYFSVVDIYHDITLAWDQVHHKCEPEGNDCWSTYISVPLVGTQAYAHYNHCSIAYSVKHTSAQWYAYIEEFNSFFREPWVVQVCLEEWSPLTFALLVAPQCSFHRVCTHLRELVIRHLVNVDTVWGHLVNDPAFGYADTVWGPLHSSCA